MEKYPLFKGGFDSTILKVLPDDVLEFILNNMYIMDEGQVESFIKNFMNKKKIFLLIFVFTIMFREKL